MGLKSGTKQNIELLTHSRKGVGEVIGSLLDMWLKGER